MQILDHIIINEGDEMAIFYRKAWEKAIAEIQQIEDSKTNDSFEDTVETDYGFEGRKILRKHLVRERSLKMIFDFKRQLKDFRCIVCKFDFERIYGALGYKFIEAHHLQPISENTKKNQ